MTQRHEIEILTGPPGCGKTVLMRDEAVTVPGRYLFALPTIDLLEELKSGFAGTAPAVQILEVHSRRGRRPTQEQLREALLDVANGGRGHAVLLTTHETLMAAPADQFAAWHLRIDEPPLSIKSGVVTMSAGSDDYFSRNFSLMPTSTGGWSILTPVGAPATWGSLRQDTLLSSVTDMLNEIGRGKPVYVDIEKWTDTKRFSWLSVWTPLALRACASIQISGAGFRESLGGRLISGKNFADVLALRYRQIGAERTAEPTIRIHYFSEKECTSRFWDTAEGSRALKQMATFLSDRQPDLGYWSGNEMARKLLTHYVPGIGLPPKVAGLNTHRAATSCAFFYSSKATANDRVLTSFCGLSRNEIRQAREDEDILQFVMRGAIRCPDFGGSYDVYLFSRAQAERLIERLTGFGFGDVAALAEEAPGLMNVVPATGARGSSSLVALSDEERRKRKTDQRKAQRAKRRAALGAGPARRGRPRKGS